jgi:hypothetical protein
VQESLRPRAPWCRIGTLGGTDAQGGWRTGHYLALATESAGVVVNDIDATETQKVVEECREVESGPPLPS